MNDHQAVILMRRPSAATALLCALSFLAAAPAGAGAWLPCNAPGIVPPAPVERPSPAFPESARLAGAEGFVELAWTVLRDGRVGWARIVRAEPSGFFEAAALDSVRQWRFEPAQAGSGAVECRTQTRLRFTLTDTVLARPAGTAAVAGEQAAPVYPEALRSAGIEGYVEIAFEVDAAGRVANAEVTLAMPRGGFEAAALAAVRQWRFAPSAEAVRHWTRRFAFTLPGAAGRSPDPVLLAAAPLPPEACTRRIAGQVRLEVETDAEGRITAARILDGAAPGLFDSAALAIARNSRLAPAYRDGEPVAATALLTLRFDPATANCPDGSRDGNGTGARQAPTPRVSGAPDHRRARVAAAAVQRLP